MCPSSLFVKGLVVGITFALMAVYESAFNVIEQVYGKKSFTWETGVISCGFWYYLTEIFLLATITTVFLLVMKCYKKRKREDVLPNDQIFAERYYSKQ